MPKRQCCVAGCDSVAMGSGPKPPDLSFHEFPLLIDIREKWCEAVNLKNDDGTLWHPDPNYQNRAHVCSLHFNPEDYRDGVKVARLKKDAVPSVFPLYKENEPRKKEKRSIDVVKQEPMYDVAPKKRKTREAVELREEPVKANFKEFDVMDEMDVNIDFPKHEPGSEIARMRRMLQKQEEKIEHLVLENYELRKQLECYGKHEQRDPELAEFNAMLKTVYDRANDGNLSAMFLLQQLKAYGNKNACWDEKILKHCISWRAKSPTGYQYAREMNILKLPSQKTLSKFVEYMSDETA